jgi:hypothetical protein
MKNLTRLLLPVLFLLGSGYQSFGQCDPDTSGCIDIDEPGQICPKVLPDAVLNVPYEVVITVIPPDSVEVPDIGIFVIDFIIVDTVENLPEGLTYEANADTFYTNSTYCILISGTPEKAGDFNLNITVTAYVKFLNSYIPASRTDSSIVITVLETAGLDPNTVNEFHLVPNFPNPFSEVTSLGFYSPFDEQIELSVYNLLGELIYVEKQGFPPGENYFDFTGKSLQSGTYIYSITNNEEVFTGKIVKVRR